MSEVSPTVQLEVLTALFEDGLLKLEDLQLFFGIGDLKRGEPPPDFNDGEDEVLY